MHKVHLRSLRVEAGLQRRVTDATEIHFEGRAYRNFPYQLHHREGANGGMDEPGLYDPDYQEIVFGSFFPVTKALDRDTGIIGINGVDVFVTDFHGGAAGQPV
jgi:hypothetical protein